jgi:hypothetical protein
MDLRNSRKVVQNAPDQAAQPNGLFVWIGTHFKLGKKPLQKTCQKAFNF